MGERERGFILLRDLLRSSLFCLWNGIFPAFGSPNLSTLTARSDAQPSHTLLKVLKSYPTPHLNTLQTIRITSNHLRRPLPTVPGRQASIPFVLKLHHHPRLQSIYYPSFVILSTFDLRLRLQLFLPVFDSLSMDFKRLGRSVNRKIGHNFLFPFINHIFAAKCSQLASRITKSSDHWRTAIANCTLLLLYSRH